MTLSACAPSGSAGRIKAGINLPAMHTSLTKRCYDPGVREGKDARVELARNRRALATCRKRHRDTVRTYRRTKREFAK